MQHTTDQVDTISALFSRMKLCFILLMFMFVSVYIYSGKHLTGAPHSYWLGIIIAVIVLCSLGYLYFMAKLANTLKGNSIAWIIPTVIFGPFGLLVSYIVISGSVVRLQRQHMVDLEIEKEQQNL
ncbi:MAG: hypothetical protein GKR92_02585 [Gammaproteobacteria bacterium]|nr:MAG: hypothetical protein GKR92_02585 [Gammaproteobacteria bacterium]